MKLFSRFVAKVLLLLCFNVYALEQVESQDSSVPIVTPPSWAIENPIALDKKVPVADVRAGIYYLLVDAQTRVTSDDTVTRYRRYVKKVINKKGLEDGSQLSFDFDPSYQALNLHSITVWRDGVAIDKIKTAKMSILQQERELDNLIYNGDHTLNVILDDIQVGDSIDYVYSIEGSNPPDAKAAQGELFERNANAISSGN